MDKITVNKKTYISIKEYEKLQKEIKDKTNISSIRKEEKAKQEHRYSELVKKYRTLYMKYKHQSDRMAKNRVKYVEIIHLLQAEVINQAETEKLLSEVERMALIEAKI